MAEYWFKPKTYGYGATPSNWKGWAVTALFALVLFGFVAWFLQSRDGLQTTDDYAIWIGGLAAITLPFIWVCWLKTDGAWRWQWGKKDDA